MHLLIIPLVILALSVVGFTAGTDYIKPITKNEQVK